MPAGVETRTLPCSHGVKLAYSIVGKGPKTLLLANGLGGRLYAWQPLVDALSDRYRFITWDYRGLFDSTAPPKRRHLSVPDHADDARAILDAEGIDKVVCCGWSMGVQVSLEFATLHPERVEGLVLLNGTYGQAFSSGLQPFFRLPVAAAWSHAFIDYLVDHPGVATRLADAAERTVGLTTWLFWLISGAPRERIRPVFERYSREVFDDKWFTNYLRLFQELDAHSVYHHLRDVEAPTLIVSGAFDWLTPPYQSRQMAKRIKGAEALHLFRASHFVLQERPEIVVPAIERFLETRVGR